MYSKAVLKKAIESFVRPEECNQCIWYGVERYSHGKVITHNVRYKKSDVPIKERYSCDCYHYANKTIHNGIWCSHVLAVILEQIRSGNMGKEYLCLLFPELTPEEAEHIEISRKRLNMLNTGEVWT